MKSSLSIIVWTLILSIFIFTGNLNAFLVHRTVAFHWNPHPNFTNLLITSDAYLGSAYWWTIKLGHFTGFAVLEGLILYSTKRPHTSAFLAIFTAVVSEVLQLYFGRDGRLYDMLIDTLGVVFMQSLRDTRLWWRRVEES